MDIATIAGLIISFAGFLGGFVLEGGHLTSLLQLSAAVIVFGGTIGAGIASSPFEHTIGIMGIVKNALFRPGEDPHELIEQFIELADKARREGLLVLEEDLQNMQDDFMRKGIQLVIDGTDADLVRDVLYAEVDFMRERHAQGAEYFENLGGFAPTFGIIGTVMGLIHVLSNLSDPSTLGPAIAAAFAATLYGVVSANALFLPLANKLEYASSQEAHHREIIIEGVLSIQAGDNPRIVREKLNAFLAPDDRLEEEF